MKLLPGLPLISLSVKFRKHLLTLDYVYMAVILKSCETSRYEVDFILPTISTIVNLLY